MLERSKKVYMIGIKGAGMTALAGVLHLRGVDVSGSDVEEEFFTDSVLKRSNIPFKQGFSQKNIPNDTDVVIYSNAYLNTDNPEMTEASNRGLSLMSYPEALAELFNASEYGIAVCGTHGKSTTTAMLGTILEFAGLDPTVILGSKVNNWGGNGRAGKGKYFVIEADEYKDAYLNYDPKMILVTNIDYDHPDYFEDRHAYRNSFQKFFFSENVETIIEEKNIQNPKHFSLKIPGEYNQQNANLAYKAAIDLGVDGDIAKKALEEFSGIARRFEYYGEYNKALLFDDYAHHPKEISAALSGAINKYKDKQVVVLFQPHTYSRTKQFFDDFIDSLSAADKVYILKTYASAREKNQNDSMGIELSKILETKYFETQKEAAEHIRKELNKDTLFLTMGAGDVYKTMKHLK